MSYQMDGHAVSKPWHTVLTHYRRVGGKFTVNSGRRTMSEQWKLYRAYKAGNGNLAAFPAPNAPHINYGRANHAVDVNATDGGADRMVKWLRSKGVAAARPVGGEPWHIEVPRTDLLRLASSIERKRRAVKTTQKPAKRRASVKGLGAAGLALITEFEGFYARPYRDPVGVWTIGYGSTKGVGPSSRPVSKADAKARLLREVNEEYAPAVFRAAKDAGKALKQQEADALISAVYNLGPGVLARGRSLGDALRQKAGWRQAVADALLLYDKAGGSRLPGLTRRRKAEANLFLNGRWK